MTPKVIQALQQIEIDELEALVVVGAGNYQYEDLNKLLEHSKYNIKLESNMLDLPNDQWHGLIKQSKQEIVIN